MGVTMLGVPAGVAPALTLSVGFDGNTIIGARFSPKPCLLLWPTECDEEVEASAADDGKEGTIKPPDEDPRRWSCGLCECCCENVEKEEDDDTADEGSSRRGMGEGVAEGGLGGKLASILTRFGAGSGAAFASIFEAVSLRWSGE